MRYLERSFSVPPAQLKADKNRHGQTWEDIFSAPGVPRTIGEFFSHKDNCQCAVCVQFREDYPPRNESADKTGHTCNGTYKTFSAEHCPYCWAEHAR